MRSTNHETARYLACRVVDPGLPARSANSRGDVAATELDRMVK
jgi:hypothetical protein